MIEKHAIVAICKRRVDALVSTQQEERLTRIVLRPNRSLNWRGNQWVILSLLFISSIISIGFAAVGAWVILPFAGLEMMALATSLYYVSWKLSYCHVLIIEDDRLTLEKGVYFPKYSWHFPAQEVAIRAKMPQHEWDGPLVSFSRDKDTVFLGEFLNKADREKLVRELKAKNLFIRSADLGRLSV